MMITYWIRRAGVGVLSGIASGIVTGIGARIAMRMVADEIRKMGEFTIEGTLNIMLVSVILGIALGLIYVAVKRFLPGNALVKGVFFGVIWLVVFGVRLFLQPATGELALAPDLGRRLFGTLIVVYGVMIALAEGSLERVMPMPRRAVGSFVGYGALLGLGVLELVLFGIALVGALLGNGS